jgi:hypothetical protein
LGYNGREIRGKRNGAPSDFLAEVRRGLLPIKGRSYVTSRNSSAKEFIYFSLHLGHGSCGGNAAPRLPYCGGPLHQAYYERKPRGGPSDLPEQYSIRMSLCCGTEGCRKRTLPPSVLFWERRVYWGVVILVLVALREGRTKGATAARLQQLFGVSRFTLTRWLRYFHQIFPSTNTWRLLSARLCPAVRPGSISELIHRFIQIRGDPQDGLLSCLSALRVEFCDQTP